MAKISADLVKVLDDTLNANFGGMAGQLATLLYKNEPDFVFHLMHPTRWQRFKRRMFWIRNRVGWTIAHFGGWIGGFDPDPDPNEP